MNRTKLGVSAVLVVILGTIMFAVYSPRGTDHTGTVQRGENRLNVKKTAERSGMSASKPMANNRTLDTSSVRSSEADNRIYEQLERLGLTEELLRDANHNALRTVLLEIREVRESQAVPDRESIQRWLTSIYKDAVQWRLREQDLSGQLVQVLAEAFLAKRPELSRERVSVPSAHLSEGYIDLLGQLMADFRRIDLDEATDAQLVSLSARIEDMVQRRKRHSDIYYKSRLRDMLLDDSVDLSSKISKARELVRTGDTTLVRFSADYFEALLEGPLSTKKRKQVERLLDEMQG